MNKKIALLLIMLLISSPLVFSIKTFEVQETEKISLQPNATDPDADKLMTTYSLPLNENGEWQTTYGDAGQYNSRIAVSDGATGVSEDVLIIVNKKEETPKIESFIPKESELGAKEDESIDFRVLATDLNKDELGYKWYLDGKEAKEGQEFSYGTTYNDAGKHRIYVEVSDGAARASMEWNVNVENVDVEGLIEGIKDVAVNENEAARLELPDFEKYGLTYTISEPLGNKNEWKTGYNDAGSYEVKVHAEGKGLSKDKIAKVVVNDADRAPVFEPIGNKEVNENEEIKIVLNAHDPDGDEITYAASNLPEGASLEENVFTWKPGYDAVRKQGFVDWVMDKFRVLSKSFYIQFTASSKDKKIVQNVIITVRDANRAPVFDKIKDIKASENDNIAILLSAHDTNDEVKYSIDNPPEGSSLKGNVFLWTPSYEVAGRKETKKFDLVFAASDGKTETRQVVKAEIIDKNRAPKIINATKSINAKVNKPVLMFVKAIDDDGDELTYTWNFGFFEKYKATANHQRIFTTRGTKVVKVVVSDGSDEVVQTINVNVV